MWSGSLGGFIVGYVLACGFWLLAILLLRGWGCGFWVWWFGGFGLFVACVVLVLAVCGLAVVLRFGCGLVFLWVLNLLLGFVWLPGCCVDFLIFGFWVVIYWFGFVGFGCCVWVFDFVVVFCWVLCCRLAGLGLMPYVCVGLGFGFSTRRGVVCLDLVVS